MLQVQSICIQKNLVKHIQWSLSFNHVRSQKSEIFVPIWFWPITCHILSAWDFNYEQEKHSSNEVEERIYEEEDVYCIEGGENSDERSLMCGNNGIVNNNEGCAVCGNPSSKVCSRCKAIKYW